MYLKQKDVLTRVYDAYYSTRNTFYKNYSQIYGPIQIDGGYLIWHIEIGFTAD